jgi:hypothetical protein
MRSILAIAIAIAIDIDIDIDIDAIASNHTITRTNTTSNLKDKSGCCGDVSFRFCCHRHLLGNMLAISFSVGAKL